MRLAIIVLIAGMLMLAACGTSRDMGEPTEPTIPKEQVKQPAKQPEAPAAQDPGLEDIDGSLQEADAMADDLDFTELDSLDEELKELENMDFE